MPLNRRTALGAIVSMAATGASASQNSSTIVITGDLGTVGKRLAPLLTGAGFTIKGVDKKRGPDEDLSLPGPWTDRLNDALAVVHLAWDVPNYNSVGGAMYNVGITQAALSAAWRARIQHFVFASSAWARPELYGGRPNRVIPAIYSESKRFLEAWIEGTHKFAATDAACIRFGQVNPKSEDQSLDPDFDGRVLMTDEDLLGLVKRCLASKGPVVLGPFDAR